MINLIYKEFKLAAHPTLYIFILLGSLVIVPKYPYCSVFLYGCLAPFITLQYGRENNDSFYTALLPIRRDDIIKGKYVFFIIVELLQIGISIPFVIIKETIPMPTGIGINTNLAYYGFGLIIFTIFNFIFFSEFYKTGYKVGRAFIVGIIPASILMIIIEILPYVRNFKWINENNTEAVYKQIVILVVGISIYIVGNILGYRKAKKKFKYVSI